MHGAMQRTLRCTTKAVVGALHLGGEGYVRTTDYLLTDLGGESHLEEELLLGEATELQLLLGVGGELRIVAQFLEHLLVQRLGQQPLRRLLLHDLAGVIG